MELSDLDKILIAMGTVSSFRNMGSSYVLSGDKCKILLDYIRELEKKVSDLNEND